MAGAEAEILSKISQLYGSGGSATVGGKDQNPFMKNQQQITGGAASVLYAYEGFQALNAPDVDYDVLNMTADYKDVQASKIEVEAEQQANLIREQFASAVGSYQTNAARRGVKIGEGSAAINVEKSAKAVGKDNQTNKDNAEFTASQLRSSADSDRKQGDYAKEINKWRKYGNFAKAISSSASTFGSAFG